MNWWTAEYRLSKFLDKNIPLLPLDGEYIHTSPCGHVSAKKTKWTLHPWVCHLCNSVWKGWRRN